MWTKRNWGPTQVGSGKFFSPYPSRPLMRQERLLSVGTDGGGYINLLCTNKDGFSHPPTDKVPGGRSVKSAQARQASPAGAPMLPFPPRPSMKTYHKSCPPPPARFEAAFSPRPSISSPLACKRATRPTAPANTNDSRDSSHF